MCVNIKRSKQFFVSGGTGRFFSFPVFKGDFAFFHHQTDQRGDGQSCDYRQNDDGIEKLGVQYAQILTDGGGGKSGRKLGHSHQTGTGR